jgi:excisionase family DNA binding protein
MKENLLSIKEVAEYLSISQAAVYGYVRRKVIPFIKIGGTLRFPESAIDRWIEEETEHPTAVRDRRRTYHANHGAERKAG